VEVLKKHIDAIEGVPFPIFVFDELVPALAARKDCSLYEFLLSLTEQKDSVQLACRNADLCLPPNSLRIFFTNIQDVNTWLTGSSNPPMDKMILDALKRRVFHIEVTGSLYTPEQGVRDNDDLQANVEDAQLILMQMKTREDMGIFTIMVRVGKKGC
jgi:hypothetical protein